MNMRRYLKQSAMLAYAIREQNGDPVMDAYGVPQTGNPEIISVRKELKIEEIQSAGWMREKGAKMVSTIQYYCTDPVTNGDFIDERMVIFHEVYVDGKGKEVGRRCFT